MPAPLRASLAEVITAARAILEVDGSDAVTMSSVAARVGVKPPSLYKKVAGRHEILGLVADATAHELDASFAAAQTTDPRATLIGFAKAYRALAAHSPRAATLLFIAPSDAALPSSEVLTALLAKLHDAMARIVSGDPQPAARVVTSWVFGFATMEQAGAFRNGGNVEEAFRWGLHRLIETL